MTPSTPTISETDIAIVGMAAHLPGAPDIATYWANLAGGVCSIRTLSEADLLAAGEDPARLRRPNYIAATATLDGFADFDAEFFGFSRKDAAILDPQHRQFLEVAWEALENAGHTPEGFAGAVGVFAGCGQGTYFHVNLCSNPDLVESTGLFLLRHTGNDKDFLATRVSHVMDLRGPSIAVQTACSTSLVAVHMAAQSLLNGECDMAFAGGVTVELPHGRGYLHTPGEILSPDGQCHAFDHRAEGTVFGSGAGCVVLRRLKDAIADGDHIWAVIKGSAVNNDGAAKAGYLAPSVDGQAACIAEALAVAGVTADTVGYVECHGTGTPIGDPIEVAALTQGFRATTEAVGFARIGSVKTNIGHLDTAAGVASLIKAALALHHRQMPPSLGYEAPNPAIDFETSPFRVNDRLTDWPAGATPRRAGVNSLGVGGTNAHVVLEEAPERADADESPWPFQPLVLSARSRAGLDAASARLAAHLRANRDQPLADIAHTLHSGRRAFDKRRVIVARTHAEAAEMLESADPRRVFSHDRLGEAPEVVFMFPGGGAQYVGMARDLYGTEPVFADWMDRGLAILAPMLDYDIRALWLPSPGAEGEATLRLKRPSVQLPLILIVEMALARLYKSWGVVPSLLIGHSMGENAAACLAGVISFEDCIALVHLRGTLFDGVAPGGMLSVPLGEDDLIHHLDRYHRGTSIPGARGLAPAATPPLDLASVNAPGLCVVSGPDANLTAFAARLAAEGVETQRIAIDIAAHSRMLDPVLGRFEAFLRGLTLHPPCIPIVSNCTGQVLSDAQATDPDYWTAHLRQPVQFAQGMATLMAKPGRIYMEMGPGRALSSLAQANGVAAGAVIPALRHPDQAIADDVWHMTSLARLWACGAAVDWEQIWGGAARLRVPLPTYPFQRKTCFIAPGQAAAPVLSLMPQRTDDIAAWGWRPHWRATAAACDIDVAGDLRDAPPQTWLLFLDDQGLGTAVAARLRSAGHSIVTVRAGDAFGPAADGGFVLSPERGREGYDALIRDLVAQGRAPTRIAHFWGVTRGTPFRPGSSFANRCMEQGFHSLLFLAQAIAAETLPRGLHLSVFTTGAAQVRGEGLPHPEKACVAGPVRIIPRELPGTATTWLDLQLPDLVRGSAPSLGRLTDLVLEELLAEPAPSVLVIAALRGERRYGLGVRATALPEAAPTVAEGAAVLITGGFGGIGLTLAEDLIRRHRARILLIARRPLPPRETWPAYLSSHAPTDSVACRILALQRLEGLGGEVMVIAADVCNAEEMRAAVLAGERALGPIRVVIHAAGVVDDAPLMTRTPAAVEEVFAPKIHGTRVLDALFPDGTLDLMVLFSSTSTVTGPAGQVDYVAANEFLNAFATSRVGGRTRVLALDWGIWTGVGMAADAMAARTLTAPAAPMPIDAPMLDAAGFDAAGNRIFTDRLGTDDWIIDGHRTRHGAALLPGTGYLEIAAEALAAQGETGPFEVRDLTFFRPLDVPDTRPRPIRARLVRSDEGYAFDLSSAVPSGTRTGYLAHAQARLLPLSGIPPRIDPAAIAARCAPPVTGTGLPTPQEAHLIFGPRWRVLASQAFGMGEGIARLTLPTAFRGEPAQGWLLHPALLDIATGWAMPLIEGYTDAHLWVPVSYASVKVWRALPADIVSHVRGHAGNHAGGSSATFDITLAAPDGQVCLEITGFGLRRLEGGLARAAPPRDAELTFDDTAGQARALSAAEERLSSMLALGIRPDEGAEAFHRAVGAGGSQIIVSSIDLPALIARTAEAEAPRSDAAAYERPDLDTAYVAPRNAVERTLAGFWQDLLGVGQVGVEDSFFDLGGHSLIAVRLFAMVKKAFRVEFPISVLFEAPTIARCAALVIERIGPLDGEAAPPAAPTRRFTHLVAMHQGEGGPQVPFFLVAGMFGNVLNLRHLAQLLGTDRPFWGLQARGLYGDAAPHATLGEAAADCIAELRQVQPHGPYLLGGFSGGGLTAWEMARQLEEAGEEVAQLVLLDTPLPVRPSLLRRDRAIIKLAELRTRGPGYLADWARSRWEWEKAKRNPPRATAMPDTAFHNAEIEVAFRSAIGVFDMGVRQGPTVLIRPPLDRHWRVSDGRFVSQGKEYVFPDNDLTRHAPALQVIEVPGDHDSMVLEPNVRVLAARLRGLIAGVKARPAPVLTPFAEAAE